MILRAKLGYMSAGFQAAGALVFALVGKIEWSMIAVFFGYMGWMSGEFYSHLKPEELKDDK